LNLAVEQDHSGLCGAVAVQQVHVQQLLDPHLEVGRGGRRAGHREDVPPAQQVLRNLLHGLGLAKSAVDPALVFPVERLPDARHKVHLGGPHQLQVLDQRREVTLGGEVGRAPIAERAVEDAASHDVAHRHEVEGDRCGAGPKPVLGRPAPHLADVALRVHRAFGRTGAAGGVDQQGQRIVVHEAVHEVVREHRLGDRQGMPTLEHIVQGFHHHGGVGQPCPGGFQGLALVVGLGVVVEHQQLGGTVVTED
jgi:hypothetical protein